MQIFPSLRRLLPALVLVFGLSQLRAQDGVLGVPVRVVISAPGSVNCQFYLWSLLPSADLPGGTLNRQFTNSDTYPANLSLRFAPGQNSQFQFNGSGFSSVKFEAPPGYRIEIDGLEKNTIDSPTSESGNIRVVPTAGGDLAGRPGVAGPLALKDGTVFWQMALGELSNGNSAGSLNFYAPAVASALSADRVYFQYLRPDDEVTKVLYYSAVRQIITPQVGVDILYISSNASEVRVYPGSRVGAYDSGAGAYPFTGYPYVTYHLDILGDGSLKVTSETRDLDGSSPATIVRTAETTLARTGTTPTFTWTVQDWHTTGTTSVVEKTWVRTTFGSDVLEASSVHPYGSASAHALLSGRILHEYPWGSDVSSMTDGSSSGVTKTFDYYPNSAVVGSYGQIRSIVFTGGAWEGFEYDSTHPGVVVRHTKPFNGYPASVPSDLAANAFGEITQYQYAADAFGQLTRPTLIETVVRGQTDSIAYTTAHTEVSYSSSSLGSGQDLITATRKEMTFNGSVFPFIQTIRKYNEEDNSTNRGQPTSVEYPDGRRALYLYYLGLFDGTSFSSGDYFYHLVIHGTTQASGNTSATTFFNLGIDSIYLVANKSTAEFTVRHYGVLVRTETRVWTGSAWTAVAGMDYTHNLEVQPIARTANPGPSGTWSATYTGERKAAETDETGRTLTYGYDAAGRVNAVTQASATGIGQLTTAYGYDAAHRRTSETVGSGLSETLVTSRAFDDAGRPTSESVPGPGGALTTNYNYTPASRSMTTTVPGGATRTETRGIDGRISDITGSAVVAQYFTYGVDGYGRRWTKVNVGTSSSARWSRSWLDWLDRTYKSERPGFTGQSDSVEENLYDDGNGSSPGTGRLAKTTRTGYAATLYAYDEFRAYRTALDVATADSINEGGTDRIADSLEYFENYSGAWWRTSQSRTYPTASGATPLTTATVRRRLTGFSSGVIAEEQSTDTFGNVTTQVSSASPSTKTVTVTTTTGGISNTRSQTLVNGFATSTTGFDGITFTAGYDSLHRPSTSVDPRTGTTTTFYHSGSAAVHQVQDYYLAIQPGPPKYNATYAYDSAGRVSTVTDAEGKAARTAYNNRGQVTNQWGDTATPVAYGYDSTYGDRTTQSTYQGGSGWSGSSWPGSPGTANTTTWAFDGPSGLVTSKTDAAGKHADFTYNVRGQTNTRTLARGSVATYSYDGNTGELTNVAYSGAGSSGMTNLGYSYTRTGQPYQVSDDTGTRTFNYDSSFPVELDSVSLPGFYGSRTLTLDQDSLHRSAGFHLGTELTQGLTYESATGRLDTVVATPTGQSARTFDYGYNSNGLLTGYTSGSLSVGRSYESNRNLLTALDSQWSGTSRTKYEYTSNSLGQRDTAKQSGSAFSDYGNSTYNRYVYDDRGELTAARGYLGATVSSTSAPLPGRQYTYGYDNAGNRTWTDRTDNAPMRNDYAANALNQYSARENNTLPVSGFALSTSTVLVDGRSATAPRQGAFWSDELVVGNVGAPWSGTVKTFAKATGSSTTRTESRTAQIPAANQSFTYDDDGNLTADGVWSYSYDAENRLTGMSTTLGGSRSLAFKYDAEGRRVEKTVTGGSTAGTTRYLYNGWSLVMELNSSASLLKSYSWGVDLTGGGAGALLQIRDHGTSTTYLPTYDGNGNVAVLLNASDGSVAVAYEYNPFGELLRKEGAYAAGNPFRFSTQFTDEETGLSYYGLRFYSSSLGRFINRDPIEEAGGLNLYGFCGNDGVNRWDNLGMWPDDDHSANPWLWNWLTKTSSGYDPLNHIGLSQAEIDWNQNIFDWMNSKGIDPQNFDVGQYEEWAASQGPKVMRDGVSLQAMSRDAQRAGELAAGQFIPRADAQKNAWGGFDEMGLPIGNNGEDRQIAVLKNLGDFSGGNDLITGTTALSRGQIAVGAASLAMAGMAILPLDGPLGPLVGKLGKWLGIGGRAAKTPIRIGAEAVDHVLERHTIVGMENLGKSVFSAKEDFRVLVRAAEGINPIKQAKGPNFERIVDAGRNIGLDRATGKPTSVYTVITDAAGNLVTSFPGRP